MLIFCDPSAGTEAQVILKKVREMENLPKVLDTYFTEREGVLNVGLQINKLGLIFRETPNADVGIDGQIEYINDAEQATGRLLAAQIKSGDSYLIDKGTHWAFYPGEKHKHYWESYPIPVLLFIYSPKDKLTYYTDARYQLNIPKRTETYIKLQKDIVLENAKKDMLFSSVGSFDEPLFETKELLNVMIKENCDNLTFSISYFDLFVQGLTNLSRQLFFSMSLAMEIADYNNESEYGLGIGFNEHEFLHNYVKFLVSQNLAKVDYADYLIDWKERELQPTFLATLTQRGRNLLDYIAEQENKLNIPPPTRLTSERLLRIGYAEMEANRFEKAKNFKKSFI